MGGEIKNDARQTTGPSFFHLVLPFAECERRKSEWKEGKKRGNLCSPRLSSLSPFLSASKFMFFSRGALLACCWPFSLSLTSGEEKEA